MVAFALLAMVGWPAAARGVSPCLQSCDVSKHPAIDCCAIEPCLVAPCSDYLACRAEAKSQLDDCIDHEPTCRATRPGGCTIILGCVRRCQSAYRARVKRCRKEAFRTLSGCAGGDCRLGRRGQQQAARVCRACTSVTVTTTTATTTTAGVTTTTVAGTTTTTAAPLVGAAASGSGDLGCLVECLVRIDTVRACYSRCGRACGGNARAVSICQGGCRNGSCLAVKARCSNSSDVDADPAYLACCEPRGSCISRDEAPCKVTTSTTSTSTTVTSTTSTTTTTIVVFP